MHELYFKDTSTIAHQNKEVELYKIEPDVVITRIENKAETAAKIKYYLGIVYFLVLTFLTIKLLS